MTRGSNIVIIGLGLIGGSLAARCRKAFPHAKIMGVTRNKSALQKAKKRGWIHEGFQDLRFFPPKADPPLAGGHSLRPQNDAIVILCTPVDTFKNLLLQLERFAPTGTMVTDAGSVKGFLAEWADSKRWRRIQFVGAHPMAGSHEKGLDAARPSLFDRALIFITPGKRVSPQAFKKVKKFWGKISKRTLVISPELHDRLTAEISHFPHLLAALLVTSASSKALGVAASGFLDTTRIAQGDADLWTPILLENRKEMTRVLKNFERGLKRVQKILQGNDSSGLRGLLKRAQTRRISLEKLR